MNEEQTKREKRKHRRVRNQLLSYLVLGALLVVVIVGIVLAVKAITGSVSGYTARVNKVLAEAEAATTPETEIENFSQEEVPASDGVTEEETAETVETEVVTVEELVTNLLSEMTIEEMVAGMFIVTPEALTGVSSVIQAGDSTKQAIIENPVGGIIYSTKNFQSAEQFTQMISNTSEYSKYPLFFAVSAECGNYPGFGIEATKKASSITDEETAASVYGDIASVLAEYGINMNLAPVADVVDSNGAAQLQGRTFGSVAWEAAPLVSAAVTAMQEKGVSSAVQKFPSSVDTDRTSNQLVTNEYVIFDLAVENGIDCITVTSARVKALTGDNTPCCLSKAVVEETVRDKFGFEGIIMTDYLTSSTITSSYTSAKAAVAAVQAGADMLLCPQDYNDAYNGLLQAVSDGTITEERIYESLYRIYLIKYKNVLENS
jgi:beta-N-acetylhexosaminidase